MTHARAAWQAGWAVSAALFLAACGSSGADEGSAGAGGDPAMNPGPAAETVAIGGTLTFDLVPAEPLFGLDYASTRAAPARGVTVELVSADGAEVLDSATTSTAGEYTLAAPAETSVFLRAKAEMVSEAWDYRVLDNTQSDALYALDGEPFDSGIEAQLTHNLHAPSGWDGAGYGGPRSAAPFAVLDAVHAASEFVLDAAPAAVFPPLSLHWSEDNVPTEGEPDLAAGELPSSFFTAFGSTYHIYLLGAENNDTEEYDRHVIVHEWGHYFEHAFSRSDSIGGPHTLGDRLDMRVAFGEGFGNALSGMVTGDSVYRDSLGPQQSEAPSFDLEGSPLLQPANPHPGWYSEQSVQEILYDLYDAEQDVAQDTLALGFAPIHAVLTDEQRESVALTSLFPFVQALKEARPQDAAAIDALVGTQSIARITDIYGEDRSNPEPSSGAAEHVLPIYRRIDVNAADPVNVCSTNDFESAQTGAVNKLGSRRYLRFTTSVMGQHSFSAVATEVPEGEFADPDMVLHRRGTIAMSKGSPDCTAATPTECSESFSMTLAPGDYVLEVYEWTNTARDAEQFPPIGHTCFDVRVTQP